MNQQGSPDPPNSQLSSTGRIDQACDQFERACQAGKPPLIEELLLQAPANDRDRLLGELLEIELDFRQRCGAFVQLEEYRSRFPESADLVERVFRRTVKTRRLGDYELLEELGHGGMGVVYKARQIYLNQIVALKILPHRYLDDAQAVNRFRREMQSIGGLSHPNIVQAYNAGEAGGVHFLVMEFVDGVNLQQFVGLGKPPGGPLGVGAACEIIRQAALGLQHAHEHQLVHRDIKPANLMLCRSGPVKLLDMGLAKFHAQRHDETQAGRLTQPGVTMGTIDYMAPEQWENSGEADIRSDIYSLGCTLFFLLTGRPPYGDPAYDSSRKKLMAHVVAPIPPLLENCADCPEDLEDVYETMLAKDPAERYAEPAEVVAAIAEFADEEELAEVVATIPTEEAWMAANRGDLQSPDVDTATRQGAGSVGSHGSPPLRQPADCPAAIPPQCPAGCRLLAGGGSDRAFGLVGHAAGGRAFAGAGRVGADRSQPGCRRTGPVAGAEWPLVVRRNALADTAPAASAGGKGARIDRSGRPARRSSPDLPAYQYGRRAEVALGCSRPLPKGLVGRPIATA